MRFVIGLFSLLPLVAALATEPNLGSSELIDTGHPMIQATAARLTRGLRSDRDKAVAIHDFVRDEIPFGFGPRFYDQKASDVLRSRHGFCNTKGALFIALLRAAGIPARQHFVDISPAILKGIVDPGTEWMDHSYTEVRLDGRWIAVDSYNADPKLFYAALRLLNEQGLDFGYGAHRYGNPIWDGRRDSFSQFVQGKGKDKIGNRDFGVYADARAFYATAPGASNRLTLQMKAFFPVAIGTLNGRIGKLRAGLPVGD